MNTLNVMKAVAASALVVATSAGATGVDKAFKIDQPSTCKATDKKCEQKAKPAHKARVLFDALQGGSESTRLPDTARYDARGGTLI